MEVVDAALEGVVMQDEDVAQEGVATEVEDAALEGVATEVEDVEQEAQEGVATEVEDAALEGVAMEDEDVEQEDQDVEQDSDECMVRMVRADVDADVEEDSDVVEEDAAADAEAVVMAGRVYDDEAKEDEAAATDGRAEQMRVDIDMYVDTDAAEAKDHDTKPSCTPFLRASRSLATRVFVVDPFGALAMRPASSCIVSHICRPYVAVRRCTDRVTQLC